MTLGIINITQPGFELFLEHHTRLSKDSKCVTVKPSFTQVKNLQETGNWQGLAELLDTEVENLKNLGATKVVMPANSPHYAVEHMQHHLPLISIVDAVVDACEEHTKVAVLGVGYTMGGELYTKPLQKKGVEAIYPGLSDRKFLNELIYSHLVPVGFAPWTYQTKFNRLVTRMQDQGCSAIVLACTELPLMVGKHATEAKYIDSTLELAKSVTRRTLE